MKTNVTVCGFIFNEGKLLLVYHKNYKMWLGVGGHLDPEETPDLQLLKEIKEETGLDVNVLQGNYHFKITNNTLKNCPIPFHADVHNVGDHNHYAQYYICEVTNGFQKVVPEAVEFEQYSWFTENEMEQHKEIDFKTKQIAKKAFEIYKKYKIKDSGHGQNDG